MHNDTCAHQISVIFHLITRRIYLANQKMSGPGFTPRQGQILHYIIDHSASGDVFQRDIEAAFTIRRPTASGILQLMEQNGLIRRESVPQDARLKKLVATEKARSAIAHADEVLSSVERDLVRGISPEELEQFHRTASKMIENIHETKK